jgi:hypothetical protein
MVVLDAVSYNARTDFVSDFILEAIVHTPHLFYFIHATASKFSTLELKM